MKDDMGDEQLQKNGLMQVCQNWRMQVSYRKVQLNINLHRGIC